MGRYNKVLLAVDFCSDNREIIEKAEQVTQDNNAELLVVHVNEPLVAAYAADGMSAWGGQLVTLEQDIRKESTQKLNELAERLGITKENRFLRDGRSADEIHDVIKENDIDLCVLGTHGQHGLQLLLGSTANSVLHGATCDVLAIRVREEDS